MIILSSMFRELLKRNTQINERYERFVWSTRSVFCVRRTLRVKFFFIFLLRKLLQNGLSTNY